MKHWERVEAALEELSKNPDAVIHELYFGFALYGWRGLADLSTAQRREVFDAIGMQCAELRCPVKAINIVGNQLYVLVRLNPDVSIENVTEAFERASQRDDTRLWRGDYSVTSLSVEDVEDLTAAIHAGDSSLRELFPDPYA